MRQLVNIFRGYFRVVLVEGVQAQEAFRRSSLAPWFPVWGGLSLRFRWLTYAPDARGINGVPPDRCYALMTELTEENCDGVVTYGRLAIHATAPVPAWRLGSSRAVPARFSTGHHFLQGMGITDGPADLQERDKMTQPDGTIRFLGRYWFRDPWRQSHLEGDDWDD